MGTIIIGLCPHGVVTLLMFQCTMTMQIDLKMAAPIEHNSCNNIFVVYFFLDFTAPSFDVFYMRQISFKVWRFLNIL